MIQSQGLLQQRRWISEFRSHSGSLWDNYVPAFCDASYTGTVWFKRLTVKPSYGIVLVCVNFNEAVSASAIVRLVGLRSMRYCPGQVSVGAWSTDMIARNMDYACSARAS